MKNMFGVNVKTEEMDGEIFKLREIDAQIEEKQEAVLKEGKAHEEKARLPLYLRVLWYVFGAGVLFLIAVVFASLETLIDEDFSWIALESILIKSWWMLLIGAVSGVGLLVIRRISQKRVETVKESEGFQETETRGAKILTETLQALGIPENAVEADIFVYPYKKKKDGKTRAAGMMYQFIACSTRIYRDEKYVYFADMASVFAVPKEGLSRLVKVKKTAMFINWNKEEAHDHERYREYKVRLNNYGVYLVKPYYSLQFLANGEEYEILFPSYELDAFCALTGLSVEEEKEEK